MVDTTSSGMGARDARPHAFYQAVLRALQAAKIPFLVGGAYAFERYTGIVRRTKDFDLMVRQRDCQPALAVLTQAGFTTELTSAVWLAKAFSGDYFVDMIFNSANGVVPVDEGWFANAQRGRVLDLDVLVCAPEEMIWSKAFILGRERCDAADVAHLLRATSSLLDWNRLIAHFGEQHWRVLFSQLILFGFIYPGERAALPERVMRHYAERLQADLVAPAPAARLCQGTLLSWDQYATDIQQWGYQDARLQPSGALSQGDIARLIKER
jgi:hypothetical protein